MKHRFCAAALAAVLLLSAAPLSPAASAAFSDAEGTWAAEVIEKAEGYGLMNGYPDGTFGVGKELTRGEFVAVLCRMFGWDAASPGAPSFSDCPASHWAYSYVETALAHGVMDAGGAFRPEDYISREEMAVMLVRALGYGTLAQSLSGLELPYVPLLTPQEKVISIVSNLTDNCNCLYSIKKDRFRHLFLEILYGGSPRFPVFLLCFCAGFGTMLLIAFEQGGLLL